MKNIIYYITLLSLSIINLEDIRAQDTENLYGYYVVCTEEYQELNIVLGTVDASSGKKSKGSTSGSTHKPSKYVAYMSAIYEGKSREDIQDQTEPFKEKYLPVVNRYKDGPNTVSHYLKTFESLNEAKSEYEKESQCFKSPDCKSEEEYEVHNINTTSEIYSNKVYFSNLIIEDMHLDGEVTVKTKFVFIGYPYIVSQYEDLTITKISYQGNSYTALTNLDNKYLPLPYKVEGKPMIDADYYIWTPRVKNPQYLRKQDYKIFTYPIKRLVSLSDHFENTEVDNYFKGFQHPEERDSYFWRNSQLQHPKTDVGRKLSPIKITSISSTLKSEIASKVKDYEYHKNRDFWGNKKESEKKTKNNKKEEDDFWNK